MSSALFKLLTLNEANGSANFNWTTLLIDSRVFGEGEGGYTQAHYLLNYKRFEAVISNLNDILQSNSERGALLWIQKLFESL